MIHDESEFLSNRTRNHHIMKHEAYRIIDPNTRSNQMINLFMPHESYHRIIVIISNQIVISNHIISDYRLQTILYI